MRRISKSIARRAALIFCTTALCNDPLHAQSSQAGSQTAPAERARIVLAHALPSMLGDRLQVSLVEVRYGPGEASSPHSHPCPVIGYVVQGTIRTQVKGEAPLIVHAGESFYEAPNGVHLISANASQTEPAKLLAYFVCDHDAPLSTNVPAASGGNQ